MTSWAFFISLVATLISVTSLTRIAYLEHDRMQPRTLSELAAAEDHLLRRFRNILLLCGTLFAIAMYAFIVPKVSSAIWVFVAWTASYTSNMLLAVIPARGKTQWVHTVIARIMGGGMLALAYLFWQHLPTPYATLELPITIAMSALALMTIIDVRRFVFYELPFLYLSHISIVIAAAALFR